MLNKLKNKYLELLSFIILMMWAISPLVEYIFKNKLFGLYTHYFTFIIYVIGFLGFICYAFYFTKLVKTKKASIKQFIPEILLGILLLISIISTILSENPQLSLLGEKYRREGLYVYIMYIGFILAASIIKDSKYIKYLFFCMIAICLLITINPLFNSRFTYYSFSNIFRNTNHYGYYLMINVMLSIFMFINSANKIKKIVYALIYIFFLYLLIRNDTFGSYLAVLATLLFLLVYAIIKKWKVLDVLIIIFTFVATSFAVSVFDIKIGERLYFEDTRNIISKNFYFLRKDINDMVDGDGNVDKSAGSYRIVLWKNAWKYTLKHPLFGGGMECLRNYKMSDEEGLYMKYNTRPHNVMLQVSSFIGIPGAIIYLVLIIYIAISNLIILKNNSVHIMVYCTAACYFLSSLLGNSMFYTSPYFMILLGLLIGFNRRHLSSKE